MKNHKYSQEELNQIQVQVEEISTPEHVIELNPTYDEFVNWCETDIGLSSERRMSIFKHAEKEFRDAGYHSHAEVIKITGERYEKTL